MLLVLLYTCIILNESINVSNTKHKYHLNVHVNLYKTHCDSDSFKIWAEGSNLFHSFLIKDWKIIWLKDETFFPLTRSNYTICCRYCIIRCNKLPYKRWKIFICTYCACVCFKWTSVNRFFARDCIFVSNLKALSNFFIRLINWSAQKFNKYINFFW